MPQLSVLWICIALTMPHVEHLFRRRLFDRPSHSFPLRHRLLQPFSRFFRWVKSGLPLLGWFSLLFFVFVSEHTCPEIRTANGVSSLWAAFSFCSLRPKRMLFLGGPPVKHRDATMSAFLWAFLLRSRVPLPICMPAPSCWLRGGIHGIGRSAPRDPPPTSSHSETFWLVVVLWGSITYSSSFSVPRTSH